MRAIIWLAVGVLVIVANPCADAQNLVVNGNFDTDVAGWTPLGADLTISFDPSDYADDLNSGSLLATNDSDILANLDVISCVNSILDLLPYQYTGWIKVPSGQTASGQASLYWYWYDLPSCTGTQVFAGSTPIVTSADDWTYVNTDSLVAPAGTMSAMVVLQAFKISAVPGVFQAYFDGLDFRSSGLIFADGFETGNTDGWALSTP